MAQNTMPCFDMPFTTSGYEIKWALFSQLRSPHRVHDQRELNSEERDEPLHRSFPVLASN